MTDLSLNDAAARYYNLALSGTAVATGAAANGAALAGNPVLIAGSDATNARTLRTDGNGFLFVSGTSASSAADTGNPVKVGGVANSAVPTAATATQRINGWFGLNGEFMVGLGIGAQGFTGVTNGPMLPLDSTGTARPLITAVYAHNGTNQDDLKTSQGAVGSAGVGILAVEEAGRLFNHITTNTTTTVKSGAGFLHTLVINTKGTATTATIYDNTAGSGTVIAVVDTTVAVPAFLYDLQFSTGLTIVTAGTTPGDFTVTYR